MLRFCLDGNLEFITKRRYCMIITVGFVLLNIDMICVGWFYDYVLIFCLTNVCLGASWQRLQYTLQCCF